MRAGPLAAPARTGAALPSVLFVHDSGPGQFGGLGRYLAAAGWQVTFAATRPVHVPGCRSVVYGPHRAPSPATHPYAQAFDRAAINAQGFVRAAVAASRVGLAPDIVVSHAGPGAGLLAREVFPGIRTVAYAEWWYNHPAPDLATAPRDAGALPGTEQAMIERTRNAAMALEIASATLALCPTAFQASQFPDLLRPALTIHHDGIDVDALAPGPALTSDPDCPAPLRHLSPDTPLVTYAARGFELHRGFPQFTAALPSIQAARPDAVVAIAGENRVAYGTDAMRRVDWLARGLETPGLRRDRLLLLGTLSQREHRWLLRRSDAHIYLTVPFVLSWSMLEAMATGCPLVLSDTAPVREFATPGTALLTDMDDSAALAAAVLETLRDPDTARRRGALARRAIAERLPAARLRAEKADMLLRL